MPIRTCHAEGCAAECLPKRRLCAAHRAASELEARHRRKDAARGPCCVEGCEQPRHETPSQVLSYCMEHRRERARHDDNARRRAEGIPVRTKLVQPEGVPPGSKWCGGCDEIKLRSLFHFDKSRPDGLQGKCKHCQYEAEAARLATPEGRAKANAYSQANGRRFRYDLGANLERLVLEDQDGLCAICRLPFGTKPSGRLEYVVDHVRGTRNDVRGFLHDGCNRGISLVNDHDPVALLGAALYLRYGSGAVPSRVELEVLLESWPRVSAFVDSPDTLRP